MLFDLDDTLVDHEAPKVGEALGRSRLQEIGTELEQAKASARA